VGLEAFLENVPLDERNSGALRSSSSASRQAQSVREQRSGLSMAGNIHGDASDPHPIMDGGFRLTGWIEHGHERLCGAAVQPLLATGDR